MADRPVGGSGHGNGSGGAPGLASSLAGSFGASVGIQVLNVATGVVLARELGPAGRGELTSIILWPSMLATLGSLGVIEATTYHTSRGVADVKALLGTTMTLGLVQSVALVAIGVGVVAAAFHGTDIAAAYLYLGFIPLNLLALYMLAILNGGRQTGVFNVLRLLVIVLQAGGILVLAALGDLTVFGVAVVYLLAVLLVGAIAAAAVVRAADMPPSFDGSLARQIVSFGLRSHSGAVSAALNERLDQLLISAFLVPARLGLYVVAATITSPTTLVGSSVALLALPAIARLPDGDERRLLARRFASLTLAASVLVTVPLVLMAPWLIDVFFGPAFRPAADVAQVLVVAAVFLSTNRTLSALLKAVGRPLDAGTAEFIALGVTVAGLAALLPALGILGAGIASLLAYGASTVWMLRRLTRSLDVSAAEVLLLRSRDVFSVVRSVRSIRAHVPARSGV